MSLRYQLKEGERGFQESKKVFLPGLSYVKAEIPADEFHRFEIVGDEDMLSISDLISQRTARLRAERKRGCSPCGG